MRMRISYLRSPNELELKFYKELLAPILLFSILRPDETWTNERRQLAQRFRRDIVRYGYLLTKTGSVMVKVEPDILDFEMDTNRRSMMAADMNVLNRIAKSR